MSLLGKLRKRRQIHQRHYHETERFTPFSTAILWGWLIASASLISASFSSDWDASSGLPDMPWFTEAGTGLFIFVGSILMVAAWSRDTYITNLWKLSQMGLVLAGSGWLGYAVAVIIANPASVVQWAISGSFTAACVCRFVSISKARARAYQNISHLRESA